MAPAKDGQPPEKRARTAAQLAQKRQADKIKHRANRAENKTRLENIERDISFLRDTSGRDSPHDNPEPAASETDAPVIVSPFINTWLESSSKAERSATTSASASTDHLGIPHEPPSISSSSPSPYRLALVDCRCGLQHHDQTDCLELKSFTMLLESHQTLSRSPNLVLSIARNPTLSNMLLHTTTDNPLTKLIGTTLKQFQARNAETLCGLYFLVYRMLRWRMYPNPEWFSDVPVMMRPTAIQNTTLHPVCIDFLPWPALRDYICQNQNKDSRHTVDLYMRSIKLNWPAEKQLLSTVFGSAVELHPDFEATVCDLGSWTLESPWTEAFEGLKRYVT
ncbi:hypothetical protein ED733_000319 [Metarhizium rileyi]|uniref:BZIP transcription factor n=1 Tax=Metarhizium rileyi (strain RCEF 4871) TaxID=1649241 RepID=A0A5C6G4J4_METRR|nr:hypothetical protein ED733_000319 [Metarhizium rileyi]